jgi:hypothetical protein
MTSVYFDGREYLDDRLFVLELAQVTTRSLTQVKTPKNGWAVITRRNVRGYALALNKRDANEMKPLSAFFHH